MVNDQAMIRALSPPGRGTAKWLARLMEIPVRTARFWSEQEVPVYRREELGRRLLARYYKKRRDEEDYLLPKLRQMAGLVDEFEILHAPNLANTAADLVGAAADGIEAAISWIEE